MIWKILQAVIGLAYQKASLLLLFLKEVLVKVLRAVLFIISGRITGKISAQPHLTLCIQFLNRGNNDKNNTFPLGKQICFTIVWGCAETLPNNNF